MQARAAGIQEKGVTFLGAGYAVLGQAGQPLRDSEVAARALAASAGPTAPGRTGRRAALPPGGDPHHGAMGEVV